MKPVHTITMQRQALKSNTIDDALAEADRLVAAEQRGALRLTGNWTLGQMLGHLASWLEYAYKGFPFTVPWFIRLMLLRHARKLIREGMPAGVRIPKAPDGTYGTEPLSTAEGAARFRAAMQRLGSGESPKFHSPALGRMTQQERIQLALRHAELHMSFAHY